METGSYLSVITLNVNGLNAPTKRQRLAEWIQKQDPYICCLQETHLKTGDTYRLKVKGWKKIFHANRHQISLYTDTCESQVFRRWLLSDSIWGISFIYLERPSFRNEIVEVGNIHTHIEMCTRKCWSALKAR